YRPIKVEGIVSDLNRSKDLMMKRALVESAMTMLKNNNNIMPLKRLDTLKIAALSIGSKKETTFQKSLSRYTYVDNFNIPRIFNAEVETDIMKELMDYNLVIVGVHNTNNLPNRKFGITPQTIELLNKIGNEHNMIVDVFGNAYSLKSFRNLPTTSSLILSYEEDDDMQDISAQIIFGGVGASGRLPVNVEDEFKIGDGITTEATRMKYTLPEDVGIWANKLARIDS
ncbi:MAG: serine hydrolase, partial [Bacteroidetes bacterium]|nr:serine hydrolase [Bacteroidota bacterium]